MTQLLLKVSFRSHRIIKAEKDLQDYQVHPVTNPYLVSDQSTECHVQPLTGHLPGSSIPMLEITSQEEFLPNVQPECSLTQLEAIPVVLSLVLWEKSMAQPGYTFLSGSFIE